MLKVMTSEVGVTIDLNILDPFMKYRIVCNLNNAFIVKIHKNEIRKRNTYISK